jgi:hypothetical protein
MNRPLYGIWGNEEKGGALINGTGTQPALGLAVSEYSNNGPQASLI